MVLNADGLQSTNYYYYYYYYYYKRQDYGDVINHSARVAELLKVTQLVYS